MNTNDIRIISPGNPEWPAQLNDLPDPPKRLYARGPLFLADAVQQCIAMVGARASTSYGEFVAADLSAALIERGYTVVSGGAYGIDAAAHRAALSAWRPSAPGVSTILVSAGGLDEPYPPGNLPLFERVAALGLLLSEHEPGVVPNRDRFLARNRIIAALGQATVVVEAALRSGSMNTVTRARTLGRPVLAVPGPVTSAVSVGCHELLRSGRAVLARDSHDVIAALPLTTGGSR